MINENLMKKAEYQHIMVAFNQVKQSKYWIGLVAITSFPEQ